MTKEELDRIKKAYSSGLKVQIWFNGYWEDFDIHDYTMYSNPFSENRQYRIVGSDYADIAEKHIKDLETELAKRAEQIEALNKDKDYFSDALDKQIEATYKVVEENNELKEKLNKATEILKVVLNKWKEERWILQSEKEVKMIENVMKEAEKFLKEE